MIETLSVRNFKILREVELELQPLTVIVGPNSSGKSSILQALLMAVDFIRNDPRKLADRANRLEAIRTRGLEQPLALGCLGRFRGEALRFSFQEGGGGKVQWREEYDLKNLRVPNRELLAAILPAISLSLDLRKMIKASHLPSGEELRISEDGEGLPGLLASLHLEERERFDRLISQLQFVIPNVLGVRVRRERLSDPEAPEFELRFDMAGGNFIPAEHVSDGTLLTLGILTALAVPEPPQLLLIDDLDRGLHPRAIGDLIQQLRKIQELDPELQIVATSHSPYLLDYLKSEEVLLTALDEDGYAAVARLTDHPEYERWKDVMAPGEFWSSVGESWIVEEKRKKTAKPAS